MKKKKRCISVLIFVVIIALILGFTHSLILKIIYPLRYEEYIEKYSTEYGLDKYLVMSLIKAESNYIYDAHSGVARGLMQITDDTAVWISDKIGMEFESDDIENPEINIKMGCYYLDYLLDYYNNNSRLALAAYNAGMGNVNKWLTDTRYSKSGTTLDSVPFEETEKYIEKVEKGIKIYKKKYQKQEE